MIEKSVVSLPPCWVADEVKAAPTLPFRAPRAQRPPALTSTPRRAPTRQGRPPQVQQGRHQDAIGMFRKVLEIDPRDVYAIYALGLSYATTGDKTGAMQQYELLRTLNPDFAANLLTSIPR